MRNKHNYRRLVFTFLCSYAVTAPTVYILDAWIGFPQAWAIMVPFIVFAGLFIAVVNAYLDYMGWL